MCDSKDYKISIIITILALKTLCQMSASEIQWHLCEHTA